MVINDSVIIDINWHLDNDIVFDRFKDYDFWIMDIFIYYFCCYCTAWNEGFST